MGKLKELFESLKDGWSQQSKKRIIENCAIIVIIGMIIIIAGGSLFGGTKKSEAKQEIGKISTDQEVGKILGGEEKNDLEKKIEEILSQIDGAGRVSVLVTYVSGKEIIPAADIKRTDNEVSEKDSGGGTRTTKQNSYESKIVYDEGQGGVKKPVVVKEVQPPVKGVVIVADGAAEPKVRESLAKAVQVLVDVPIHKIQILERKK